MADISLGLKKGVGDTVYIGGFYDGATLVDPPTLAAGDVQISKDSGAFENIASLPTVVTGETDTFEQAISDAEANCDRGCIRYKDAVGGEWDSFFVIFRPSTNRNSDLSTLTAAQVNAECDTALTDYDGPTDAEMDAGFAGLNDPTAAVIAEAVFDEAIADHVAAGSTGETLDDTCCTLGDGATLHTYTVTDSGTGLPLPGVVVRVTTDIGGANIIATGTTDAFGEIIFYLDPGTYYMWSFKPGYTFTNPDTEVVP